MDKRKMTATVTNCSACGKEHKDTEWMICKDVEKSGYTHYSYCPNTDIKLYLKWGPKNVSNPTCEEEIELDEEFFICIHCGEGEYPVVDDINPHVCKDCKEEEEAKEGEEEVTERPENSMDAGNTPEYKELLMMITEAQWKYTACPNIYEFAYCNIDTMTKHLFATVNTNHFPDPEKEMKIQENRLLKKLEERKIYKTQLYDTNIKLSFLG